LSRGGGCPEGSDGLRRFRAIVLSTSNVNAIPDGLLYTCTFTVKAGSGTAILQNLNAGASDPAGTALTADVCDGSITIGGGAVTPTSGVETPTPTATEIVVPTSTVPVVPTNTVPVAPTRTQTPSEVCGDDDDGCQITAPGQAGTGWLLLIPLAGLFWLRRRSR